MAYIKCVVSSINQLVPAMQMIKIRQFMNCLLIVCFVEAILSLTIMSVRK